MMEKKICYQLFCGVLAFLFTPILLFSQVYFQVERANFIKPHKFVSGQKIWYKTVENPEWKRSKIFRLFPEEDYLILGTEPISLNEITHIGINNTTAQIIGGGLMSFGVSWYVFGGLGALANRHDWGWDTTIIGGVGVGLGYLITKLYHRRSIEIGKGARIRILDLSFPSSPQNGISSNIGLQLRIPLSQVP